MNFFLDCIPPTATHQSTKRIFRNPKTGKVFHGTNTKGKGIQRLFDLLLMPHRPAEPLTGAVSLEVDWVFPFRKGETKKNKALGRMPRPTKPDCDNLLKHLGDSLERVGFFAVGDQQISEVICRKFWGERTGVAISLKKK